MRIGIACCLACLMTGCLFGGRAETIEHFVVNPPSHPAAAQPQPGAPTLGLRPLIAASQCRLEIAYRQAERIGYREQEWAEPPARTITRALADAFSASGAFSDVGDAADLARPDYMLFGEVRDYCENLDKTPAEATIEVRIEVRRARDIELLWAGTLTAAVPLDAPDSAALTRAMGQAVSRIAGQAVSEVTSALQTAKPVSES